MGDLLFLSIGPRRGMRRGTSAIGWYDRGCALEDADPAAAMDAYERAVAGQPGLADAHNNLGRLLHDRGELAAAESCYRLAICAAGPERSRGNLVSVRGDRHALSVEPIHQSSGTEGFPKAAALYWFNLGVVVEDQGRAAEAIAAYERAVELDASLPDAHFNLARIYELRGRANGEDAALRLAVRHLLDYRKRRVQKAILR